jgi:hypothetical protein
MKHTFIAATALAVSAVGQNLTDPTSCVISDLFPNPTVSFALPGTTVDRASILAHEDGSSVGAIAPFSFVSGLTQPGTGREFALIGASNGLLVVDTHNPTTSQPPPTPWMQLVQETNPQGCEDHTEHRGCVAFNDLIIESNRLRPTVRVFQLTTTTSGFNVGLIATIQLNPQSGENIPGSSYRLAVDPARAHLYVPGCPSTTTANGQRSLKIFDLTNIATNQTPIAVWLGGTTSGSVSHPMNSFDVHLTQRNGAPCAVVSEYIGGSTGSGLTGTRIAVLDTSNLSATSGSPYVPTSWAMFDTGLPNHSTWLDPTGVLLYNSIGDAVSVVHKISSMGTGFVSMPPFVEESWHLSNPPLIQYNVNGTGPFHHTVEGLGMTGFVAAWDDGLQIVDLRRDAISPRQLLAGVKTCPSTGCAAAPSHSCVSNVHHGVWSVYRNQDSGVIYLSDQATGLYLVRAEVGHLHRFGKGVGDVIVSGNPMPTISLLDAPPRVSRPQSAQTATRTLIPALDQTLTVTIGNLQPVSGVTRLGVLEVCLLADVASTAVYSPPAPNAGPFPRYGGATVFTQFFSVTSNTATVALPMSSVPDTTRLYLQAAVAQDFSGTFKYVAVSRGAFFGTAAQQQ